MTKNLGFPIFFLLHFSLRPISKNGPMYLLFQQKDTFLVIKDRGFLQVFQGQIKDSRKGGSYV